MRNLGNNEIFTIYLVEIRLNIFPLNLTQILPILVRGFLGCSEPHWSGLHKYVLKRLSCWHLRDVRLFYIHVNTNR